MKIHELIVSPNRSKRRAGRGISAGRGRTAGRGTKGQKSRTGKGRKPGFEGGSNPLMKRLPKLRGFRSHRPKMDIVYTGQLNDLGASIDNFILAEAGIVPNPYTPVKLIVKGDLTKKKHVKLQASSQQATALIQKLGGTFTVTAQVKRQPQSNVKNQNA